MVFANWNYESVRLCVWRVFYVGWMLSRCVSSSVVDITGAKEMCSVSVSHSKVFTFSGSRLTLEVWCIAVDNVCS